MHQKRRQHMQRSQLGGAKGLRTNCTCQAISKKTSAPWGKSCKHRCSKANASSRITVANTTTYLLHPNGQTLETARRSNFPTDLQWIPCCLLLSIECANHPHPHTSVDGHPPIETVGEGPSAAPKCKQSPSIPAL